MIGERMTYKAYYDFYAEPLIVALALVKDKLVICEDKIKTITAIARSKRKAYKPELKLLRERRVKLVATIKSLNRMIITKPRYKKYLDAIFLESALALAEGYVIDTKSKMGTLVVKRWLSKDWESRPDKETAKRTVDWPNTVRNRIDIMNSGIGAEDLMSFKNLDGTPYLKFRDEQPCWYYVKIQYKSQKDSRFYWYTFVPTPPEKVTEDTLYARLRDLRYCLSCNDESVFQTMNKPKQEYEEVHSEILNIIDNGR